MIYFDNSATTMTRPEVAELVAKKSVESFFNPSSIYGPALATKKELEDAKSRMLALLGANHNDKIIFTGSATEANNLVLNGLAKKNKKILVSKGEHPSVFEVAKNLGNNGYMVEYIDLNADGTLDIDSLVGKLSTDVGLVSIIHASNETGAINDIENIAHVVKQVLPDCLVHCDGVQAFGKIRLDLSNSYIDAYTMSSHKIHGPKGVACLYLKQGINIKPHILGGGQENGLRSGTENLPGILGFVFASELMYQDFDAKRAHIADLWDYFAKKLATTGLKYQINSPASGLKNIFSVSFEGVRGEVLLHCLEKYEIYVSTGSACSSKSLGNRVLLAMKQSTNLISGNIRFSFSEFNTTREIDIVIDALTKEIPLIQH